MKLESIVTTASLGALALAAALVASNAPHAGAAPAAPAPASPAPVSNCVSYCTAGTSTNGCVATMSCSGVPSVAAPSGFVLTTSQLEGQKNACMKYSISGTLNAPWVSTNGSFLCIKAPQQKMGPPLNSGGTFGACDGAVALDFLTWSADHSSALGQPLVVGSTFYVQTFYKDPPAPKTINLSDALTFIIEP